MENIKSPFQRFCIILGVPESIIALLFDGDTFMTIRLHREHQEVVKGAHGYVVRVKSMHGATLCDLTAADPYSPYRKRAEELMGKTHYCWQEIFKLEILAFQLLSDSMLRQAALRLVPVSPNHPSTKRPLSRLSHCTK